MAKSDADNIDKIVARLCKAISRSRYSLRQAREERREAAKQFVGIHWSEDGAREPVPMNMLALYVSIVGRNLIAKNPRVLLSTFDKQNKPIVHAMQTWVNQRIEQIRYANTIKRVVVDALFSVGILKVALATPADSAIVGWNLLAGTPFAERVDLDDFVYDVHARDFAEAAFIGHRIRLPLEAIKGSKFYDRKVRKGLAPSTDQPYNVEGDERIGLMGRGFYSMDDEEMEDMVTLWEIYLPRHRKILTLPDDLSGPSMEILSEQRWIGPDTGPYHFLGLGGTVPGNAMPKGPIQDLVDLHVFINQCYRKLMRQGLDQKELLLIAGGAMEDGDRIQKASDGDIIRSDHPERAQAVSYRGPNQQIMALFIDAIQRFSYLCGNLDMMGGLSPQSQTLGQDRMLQENASHTIKSMQDDTIDFVGRTLSAMCWYWAKDPYTVMKSTHTLQGQHDFSITRLITPQMRNQVPFEELGVRVEPYSLQSKTPKQRMAEFTQMVGQIVPMMPLYQAQGIGLDLNFFLEKAAEWMDMPDLSSLVTVQEPPPPQGAPGGDGGGDIPQMGGQEKTNTRISMPGRTQAGNDKNMVSSMLGVNPGGSAETNGHITPAGS